MGVVREIYERFDFPYTQVFERRMQSVARGASPARAWRASSIRSSNSASTARKRSRPPTTIGGAILRIGERQHADRAELDAVGEDRQRVVVALRARDVEQRQVVLGRRHRHLRRVAQREVVDERRVVAPLR